MKNNPNAIDAKWWTLIGTVAVQFALGSVYTWSLFNFPLANKLHQPLHQVAFAFGMMTLSLAITSSLAAKMQEKFGVRRVTRAAGLLFLLSMIATAYAPNLWVLYLSAGLLLGIADGAGYLITLSNCVKFFPKSPGLASACAIGAYGLGSLGFKFINLALLSHFSLHQAFILWGGVVMLITVAGAALIQDAPLHLSVDGNIFTTGQFTLAQALRTSQFWLLSIIFITNCLSGLYVIGVAKNIGENYAHLNGSLAAESLAIIAIANLTGRLVMGILSDKIARIRVVSIALTISFIGITALIFFPGDMYSFYLSVACIAFSFGGTITVFPSLISDFFGLSHLTKNYGVIYLGFGIGSLMGSIVAAVFGGFISTFYLIMTLLFVALIISVVIQKPQHKKKTLPVDTWTPTAR